MSQKYSYLKERLFQYTKWNGECLESTYKAHSQSGYALMKFERSTKGAHRISWMVHHGDIPDGLWVLHKCDNPLCIRIEHLYLGTPNDNSKDMQKKGRDNYISRRKYSQEIVNKAIEMRRNKITHKQIAYDLNISMSTLNSFFRRNNLKEQVKDFYCISKYPKEIIEKAFELRKSGIACKDIQIILGIPKRSLSRIFNQKYKRVYSNH